MDYDIAEELYLYPTPAGAFYAVSGESNDQARKVINAILRLEHTPKLTLERIRQWAAIAIDNENEDDVKGEQEAATLLKRMQDAGWIQGCEAYKSAPEGTLEECLPHLLRPLSNEGKVLLADNQGLHISHVGFPYETVEQLSALSADISILHDRHSRLLSKNLGLSSSAWATVDAAGNSQTGFWPLYIGTYRLVLVINGLPRLNQASLTQLIWALSIRYGANESL
ncbi:MAG: hypothetical protein ACC707_08450 [Thiohalomonadales bacterium]